MVAEVVRSKPEKNFLAVGTIFCHSQHTPALMDQYLVHIRLFFFKKWWGNGNFFIQMYWSFDITLYVTKQFV